MNGNQVNHFGFADTAEEITLHKERLGKRRFLLRDEMDTTCCYAVQDKFWVTDPDGNEWEFFYTKADSDVHKIEDSSCCMTSK